MRLGTLRLFRSATDVLRPNKKRGSGGAAPKYNCTVGGWEKRGCSTTSEKPAFDTLLQQLVEYANGGFKIYAIIETGGKQYKVSPGQTIDVEKLNVAKGNTVDLDRVLLIAADDKVTVGSPTIDGAKVVATSEGEGRGKKIIVFKYKSKLRYRKKTGHRQPYTRLTVDRIVAPEASEGEPMKKVRRRKKEVIQSGT